MRSRNAGCTPVLYPGIHLDMAQGSAYARSVPVSPGISLNLRPTAPLHRWVRRARMYRPEVAERLEAFGLDASVLDRVEAEGVPVSLPELLKLVAVSVPRDPEQTSSKKESKESIEEELPPNRWPRRRGNPRRLP